MKKRTKLLESNLSFICICELWVEYVRNVNDFAFFAATHAAACCRRRLGVFHFDAIFVHFHGFSHFIWTFKPEKTQQQRYKKRENNNGRLHCVDGGQCHGTFLRFLLYNSVCVCVCVCLFSFSLEMGCRRAAWLAWWTLDARTQHTCTR